MRLIQAIIALLLVILSGCSTSAGIAEEQPRPVPPHTDDSVTAMVPVGAPEEMWHYDLADQSATKLVAWEDGSVVYSACEAGKKGSVNDLAASGITLNVERPLPHCEADWATDDAGLIYLPARDSSNNISYMGYGESERVWTAHNAGLIPGCEAQNYQSSPTAVGRNGTFYALVECIEGLTLVGFSPENGKLVTQKIVDHSGAEQIVKLWATHDPTEAESRRDGLVVQNGLTVFYLSGAGEVRSFRPLNSPVFMTAVSAEGIVYSTAADPAADQCVNGEALLLEAHYRGNLVQRPLEGCHTSVQLYATPSGVLVGSYDARDEEVLSAYTRSLEPSWVKPVKVPTGSNTDGGMGQLAARVLVDVGGTLVVRTDSIEDGATRTRIAVMKADGAPFGETEVQAVGRYTGGMQPPSSISTGQAIIAVGEQLISIRVPGLQPAYPSGALLN